MNSVFSEKAKLEKVERFDNDLLTAEPDGFSHNKPKEIYYGGKFELYCGKKMLYSIAEQYQS